MRRTARLAAGELAFPDKPILSPKNRGRRGRVRAPHKENSNRSQNRTNYPFRGIYAAFIADLFDRFLVSKEAPIGERQELGEADC